MQDSPSPSVILALVGRALEEGLAKGFAQKVAANALGISRRELELGAYLSAMELESLGRLQLSGDLHAANAALAVGIRSGTWEGQSDELVGHLIRTTLAKLEIDQPAYPPFVAWKEMA